MRHSAGLLFVSLLFAAAPSMAEVPIDKIPNVLSLPPTYPESWIYVYTLPGPFAAMLAGFYIVDVSGQTREIKGQFQGAFRPVMIDPVKSPELYVAESFFDHGGHGKRTDVLTIVDKAHLSTTEIKMPAPKRNDLGGNLMDLSHDGRFVMTLNFTPAVSVMVVDVGKRHIVGEIPIPGCTSIYPTGAHGFSALCQNGTLTTFVLDERGKLVHENRSAAFNDIDRDVLYLNPTTTGGVTYFLTEKGTIRPIDMSTDEPKIMPAWPIISAEQAADGWRTVQGMSVAGDDAGRIYVRVFRETGYEKLAKDSMEVWVYDPTTQKRVMRIPMKNGAHSMMVTRGKAPFLVVVANSDPDMGSNLDVYDTATAKHLRSIGGWYNGTDIRLVQAQR